MIRPGEVEGWAFITKVDEIFKKYFYLNGDEKENIDELGDTISSFEGILGVCPHFKYDYGYNAFIFETKEYRNKAYNKMRGLVKSIKKIEYPVYVEERYLK